MWYSVLLCTCCPIIVPLTVSNPRRLRSRFYLQTPNYPNNLWLRTLSSLRFGRNPSPFSVCYCVRMVWKLDLSSLKPSFIMVVSTTIIRLYRFINVGREWASGICLKGPFSCWNNFVERRRLPLVSPSLSTSSGRPTLELVQERTSPQTTM